MHLYWCTLLLKMILLIVLRGYFTDSGLGSKPIRWHIIQPYERKGFPPPFIFAFSPIGWGSYKTLFKIPLLGSVLWEGWILDTTKPHTISYNINVPFFQSSVSLHTWMHFRLFSAMLFFILKYMYWNIFRAEFVIFKLCNRIRCIFPFFLLLNAHLVYRV